VKNARPDLVARVLPDVPGFERELDYLVPPELVEQLQPGSIVRVPLQRRKARAWVLAFPVEAPAGVRLRAIAGVSGWGPEQELLELAAWAAWRWAGRRRSLLVAASPRRNVKFLPLAHSPRPAHAGQLAGDGSARPAVSRLRSSPAERFAPASSSPAERFAPASHALPPALARSGEVGALLAAQAWRPGTHIIRLPPAAGATELVVAAAKRGPVLVLAPTAARAETGRSALRARGLNVALLPAEWAQARAGSEVVIGARGAAWGPCPGLASVVVLDAHDEAYVQGQAPTWSAVEVVAERAKRAQVPCFWVTPCPTLEMLAAAASVRLPSRSEERAGWAACQVVDRRRQDPREGLFSRSVVAALRDPSRRVVCVINRKGRSTLLDCAACGELATCEHCGSAVRETARTVVKSANALVPRAVGPSRSSEGPELARVRDAPHMLRDALYVLREAPPVQGNGSRTQANAPSRHGHASRAHGHDEGTSEGTWLECWRCGQRRPVVCAKCGSTALRALRLGVSGVREQAEALAGREVAEVMASCKELPDAPVLIGTESVLYREAEVHRTGGASVVAFLDFDQDLLATRYRAGEEALALLARASRLVGGRAGRVVVQTRWPEHPVVRAALLAEPTRLTEVEAPVRMELRLPPFSALALLSGPGAEELAASVSDLASIRGPERAGLAAQSAGPAGQSERPAGQSAGPAGQSERPAGQSAGPAGQSERPAGQSEEWLEVSDLGDGRWLARASRHEVLSRALASARRPDKKVRVEVGPVRL